MVSTSQHDWSLHRKGPQDQARHSEKIKEAIKENLPEIIAEESIITSDGKKLIKVPIRSLEEYRFRFDPNQGDKVGQGDGDSRVGDVIGHGPGKQGGQGKQAGDAPGTDFYEAEVTVDDLAELIFADLGLPDLRPKATQEIPTENVKFTEVRRTGPMANLDKRRTIRENLKRNALHGTPGFGSITNDDLRFKVWEQETRPTSSAVVLAMRDASGSMGEFKKYITRSLFFWMIRFLRTKYQDVQIVLLTTTPYVFRERHLRIKPSHSLIYDEGIYRRERRPSAQRSPEPRPPDSLVNGIGIEGDMRMPTSGTHITVVEQVALSDPKLMALLGDPKADPDTPEGTMMRFAKLGAVGPDVFYMLGDFNDVPATELQNLENFLVKVGGTTACISDLSERVNKWLTGELDKITAGIASELQQTSTLLSGIVTNGFMALLVDSGVNVWSFFRSPRQQDLPRQNWFWADCLHYEYTGRFAKQLLNNARKTGNKNLYAYALGYLTHYVTDVVGHPYVNQVVQGPYRMHWQRHHLVENFIDAYTWDRWHVQQPDPGGSEERPLDLPTGAPNPINSGAPALMSRLHDHINVGESSLGDPVDAIIEGVCQKIEKGLFDIGVLEKLDMDAPEGDDFKAWTELMVKTLQDVYTDKIKHPTILAGPPDPRPNGYPLPEDVAGAYGVLRLLLKISTEADVEAPVFPDIVGDITKVIEDTMQKVSNDIGGIPPFPTPNTSGSFSLDALLDALSDIAQWLGEVLEGVGKALVDLIAGIAGVGETLVVDSIKVLLWLLNSALYAMYRYFRDVLVLNAYSLPYTDELAVSIGGVRTGELWTSMGNLRTGQYPAEENPNARLHIFNPYRPYIQPALAKTVEMPPVAFTAPYGAGSRPEAFLETAAGPDNMFNGSALQTQVPVAAAQGETTFTDTSKQFGGAIKNSAKAILAFETIGNDLMLPDFDMDGDRGYAWPCWQVDPTNPTLLDPTKVSPVHVDAVEITD